MKSLMIDWETLDDVPTAAVTTGCVIPFDDEQFYTFGELLEKAVSFKLDTATQIKDGRTYSDDCIQNFWMKLPEHVRSSQLEAKPNDISPKTFLEGIYKVCSDNGIGVHELAYCRGMSFDFPILTDMVRQYMPELDYKMFPVGFWNQRDVRSIIAGYLDDPKVNKVPLPIGSLDGFEYHNPVHDCIRAILHLRYARAYARGEVEVPEEFDPNSLV